jgi:hypothetical protein
MGKGKRGKPAILSVLNVKGDAPCVVSFWSCGLGDGFCVGSRGRWWIAGVDYGSGRSGAARLEPHDAMKGLLPDFLKYGCFPEREKRRFQENQFHFVFI